MKLMMIGCCIMRMILLVTKRRHRFVLLSNFIEIISRVQGGLRIHPKIEMGRLIHSANFHLKQRLKDDSCERKISNCFKTLKFFALIINVFDYAFQYIELVHVLVHHERQGTPKYLILACKVFLNHLNFRQSLCIYS